MTSDLVILYRAVPANRRSPYRKGPPPGAEGAIDLSLTNNDSQKPWPVREGRPSVEASI